MFPIGNTRMLLFETLYYLVKLTVNEKVSLINEINATIWHMLIVGFFSNRLLFFVDILILKILFFRLNDIYLQIAFNILEIAIESGSEDTLVNIFFKSNLVGSLYNAYDEFSKNEVQNKANNVDSFLYYTKKLVRLISQLNKVY